MASTIKVNTIQNTCGADIIKESSNTITIGASGDTVTLASGASQTGFGRTGTVDWQTSIKTGDFTAVSGEGYFINTTSGAISMTLPASPSAGAIVSVKDYAQTFDNNALTVVRNGSNFNGGSSFDPSFSDEGAFLTFIYADSTKGWLVTDSSTNTQGATDTFIAATGGNATLTNGDFKTHVFTGPGTFCVSAAAGPVAFAEYLVVAGGGGTENYGGGGAGGFRSTVFACIPAPTTTPLGTPTKLSISPGSYSITVGAGGAGAENQGSSSVFSTITSAGGGGGRSGPNAVGQDGGSGGGGRGAPAYPGTGFSGGAGNVPSVSPPQGNPGGAGFDGISVSTNGGGGGGAGAAGTDAPSSGSAGATGGIGSYIANAVFGPTAPSYGAGGPVSSTRYFSGGGGGGSNGGGTKAGGAGGGASGTTNASNGTANTGGGAGAGNGSSSGNGTGGSGIVIIRDKFQ